MPGAFPRDPSLIPLLCLDVVLAWALFPGIRVGAGWDAWTALFYGAIAVVPVVLVALTGVWVDGTHVVVRLGLGSRRLRYDEISGFAHKKSFWTNGIRVLSLVTSSGEVVPVPGWWLRGQAGDKKAIERIEEAVGASSPLPVFRGRI